MDEWLQTMGVSEGLAREGKYDGLTQEWGN